MGRRFEWWCGKGWDLGGDFCGVTEMLGLGIAWDLSYFYDEMYREHIGA